MKKLITVFTIASVITLGFFTSTSEAAGDAAKGKEKYDSVCATCHGPTGKGDGVAAAALDPKPRDLSDASYVSGLTNEYMTKVIKGGGAAVGKSPIMPAWEGILTPDDIQNVIAYIRNDICKCQPK